MAWRLVGAIFRCEPYQVMPSGDGHYEAWIYGNGKCERLADKVCAGEALLACINHHDAAGERT